MPPYWNEVMLIYKIHPAIGVGRVGNNPDKFFVGPEMPGHPGFEIHNDDTETSIADGSYTDAGNVKRQAARFRVFEYDQDAAGAQTFNREITADDATITWQVDLVNRKAALDHTPPHNGIDPSVAARPRNAAIVGAARARLVIHDNRNQTISGKKQSGVVFDQGEFLGNKVYLGELRTDIAGRLLVLGGRGKSAVVPPGGPTTNFANNDFWHDDVADGPVTATITFPGGVAKPVEAPAWVTIAPPDFAPGIGGIVTLHDVAFQAAILAGFRAADATPSFRRHILPIIMRAANLRFVGDQNDTVTGMNIWGLLPRDPILLSSNTPSNATLRSTVVDALTSPTIESVLRNAVIPAFLRTYLAQYAAGTFQSDLSTPLPPLTQPEALDRAALEACVGLNFFPGIEASQTMRENIYSEAFRFDHNLPKVTAGFLTEVMACPWQADFKECEGEWWPSQRPDMVMTAPDNIPGSRTDWAAGVGTRDAMVAKWATLPFVVPATSASGQLVYVKQ
jgi:L-Lysine epsilon oxidase N-terminal/L-lysine epsilon oxidase C-terminal domain